MKEKKFKQVCECINCGNEADMMITCTLKPEEEDRPLKVVEPKSDDLLWWNRQYIRVHMRGIFSYWRLVGRTGGP